MSFFTKIGAPVALLIASAAAVPAATLKYEGVVNGAQEVPPVATRAEGMARLSLNDMTETLSFKLRIRGISLGDLVDISGLGPVHLHTASAGQNGGVLVPFREADSKYRDTARGFVLKVRNVSFDDLKAVPTFDFDAFVEALNTGGIYVNVHTASVRSGQVRGQIGQVPLPASGVLLLAAAGGMLVLRRKRRAV